MTVLTVLIERYRLQPRQQQVDDDRGGQIGRAGDHEGNEIIFFAERALVQSRIQPISVDSPIMPRQEAVPPMPTTEPTALRGTVSETIV